MLGRAIRSLVPRAYALFLILLICWLTWLSVRYLATSLFSPSVVPAQIAELPTRLDSDFLQTDRTAWQALDATEHPRTPLAHYHRLDSWIHPDSYNGCTQSGCHGPMPHTRRKETRAFLNMHATSMHCGVCHMKSDETSLLLGWYDLDHGEARDPPALLQLYGYLTSEDNAKKFAAPGKVVQETIVKLLRRAAKEADDLPALEKLADHFTRVRPTSESFQKLIESARTSLPRHFRGEYGAKLAITNPDTGEPILGHPGTKGAVREFLDRADSIEGEARTALLDKVHPRRRDQAIQCTSCHHSQQGQIDFAGAGYPPARVDALVNPVVAQMIEHIDKGKSFQMPEFIAPDSPARSTHEP